VNGVSWRELCRDTSLDQGDVCRMLRRTVEVLRQVGVSACVVCEDTVCEGRVCVCAGVCGVVWCACGEKGCELGCG
jgi:DSHCT (NUC185) domain